VDEDKDYSKWTVLREGDGGRHVHELQTALVHQGFWPGEDDMLWWQFGSDTCSAVQTFQVCFRLLGLNNRDILSRNQWDVLNEHFITQRTAASRLCCACLTTSSTLFCMVAALTPTCERLPHIMPALILTQAKQQHVHSPTRYRRHCKEQMSCCTL